MKREEKNMLSRQRILEAVLREFSQKGYEGASLNTVCAENGISKGIVYHYFKDKDELYLFCAADCFEKLTAYLKGTAEAAGHRARPPGDHPRDGSRRHSPLPIGADRRHLGTYAARHRP